METLGRVCEQLIEARYDERSIKAFLLFPKVCSGKWGGKAWRRCAKEAMDSYPSLKPGLADKVLHQQEIPQSRPSTNADSARARAVARLIKEGHLRKAARCLVSDGTAELDANGINQLRALHPQPDDNSPPFTGQVPHPSLQHYTTKLLDEAIKKLPGDSAPGPSGWTFAMIRECWTEVPRFQDALEGLGRLLLGATEDFPARDWLCASRLIPIKKKPSGIRPIACGEAITRALCRWFLSANSPDDVLLPEQFGVGSPGGVEPVVWSAADAISNTGCNGFLCIDFSNAFNTVSRHRIASTVRQELPCLYKTVKLLYNKPSPLLVRHQDGVETIHSSTGVRQGDPLGPLLFSLAIKSLVAELKADWAVGGRIWAYLDDIFLEVRDQQHADDIVRHLNHQNVRATYGLSINADKCRFFSGTHLRSVGCDVLGSWVGGPDDNSNQGAALGKKQALRLRERTPCLDSLPLQQRLILLRWCCFPCMVHLLRSQHPTVSLEGATDFDRAVEDALARWVGPLSEAARVVAHLPTRLGGLGMFRQATLGSVAAGASFVLSHGFLRERGSPLSERQCNRMRGCVKVCADNLNLQTDDLLAVEEWKNPHLQRRAAEVLHERAWDALFKSLDFEKRRRLLESSSPLARA